jgi:hypothetical protein
MAKIPGFSRLLLIFDRVSGGFPPPGPGHSRPKIFAMTLLLGRHLYLRRSSPTLPKNHEKGDK